MKNLILSIFIIIPNILLGQQNLVPNPSFELISNCPTDFHDFSEFLFWQNPTISDPSIFNECNLTSANVPANSFGFQLAHSGLGYSGFSPFTPLINYREYIKVELSTSLVANVRYKVNFYVSLADSSIYAVNNIGAYFSVNNIYQSTNYNLNYLPQILNDSTNPLTDKIKWTLIEGNYIATGGERYLLIGNFSDDYSVDTIFVGGSWGSFYYIDDVFVGLDTTVNSSEKQFNDESVLVFPNPTNDLLYITYYLDNDYEFELFDILGKKILSHKLCANFNNETVLLKDFAEGIYYYKIKSNNKIIRSEKLLIVK